MNRQTQDDEDEMISQIKSIASEIFDETGLEFL